jgi:hypothetical protein
MPQPPPGETPRGNIDEAAALADPANWSNDRDDVPPERANMRMRAITRIDPGTTRPPREDLWRAAALMSPMAEFLDPVSIDRAPVAAAGDVFATTGLSGFVN